MEPILERVLNLLTKSTINSKGTNCSIGWINPYYNPMKNSTQENTTIGILNGYSYDELCTVADLREHISTGDTIFKPYQYCDWRYNTDLRRFAFDPYTGEKIDWKEVLKLISMNYAKC